MNLLTKKHFLRAFSSKISLSIIIATFALFSCQDKNKDLGLSLPNQASAEVIFSEDLSIDQYNLLACR
jgi:hypothetical protein